MGSSIRSRSSIVRLGRAIMVIVPTTPLVISLLRDQRIACTDSRAALPIWLSELRAHA